MDLVFKGTTNSNGHDIDYVLVTTDSDLMFGIDRDETEVSVADDDTFEITFIRCFIISVEDEFIFENKAYLTDDAVHLLEDATFDVVFTDAANVYASYSITSCEVC